MYNNFPQSNSSFDRGISFRNKVRRMSMEKKSKVCALSGILIITLLYVAYAFHAKVTPALNAIENGATPAVERSCPLTKPEQTSDGVISFRIGIISDLDENSKSQNKLFTWVSFMKRGKLNLHVAANAVGNKVSVVWDNSDIELTSSLAQGGRGMELSELVCFDGKILSVDDRTGVVYQIIDRHVSPWVVMSDGDGSETKGFKGEWATVKDGKLFIGGLGKEWTTRNGEILNFNPQYVKVITPNGAVTHVNWVANYKKLLKAAGIQQPGYLIHESAFWSSIQKRWYFLPRRASKLKYDDKADERRGTNMILSCTEDFSKCDRTLVGPLNLTHGFSSFKFIPGTNEQQIVALKTEEVDGQIATYIMAFDFHGRILMKEQKIPGSYKFEGIEFL